MTSHSHLSIDWRHPWQWPIQAQRVWWCVAVCVGACAASPWWLAHWQVWTDAQTLAEKISQQQDETRIHQQRIANLKQQLAQEVNDFAKASDGAGHTEAVTRALIASARTHQLEVSRLSLDPLEQPAALHALSLQHLPVHLQVQGVGKDWLRWWAQWPAWAPAASVSSLSVTTGPADSVVVQLKLLLPQRSETTHKDWTLAAMTNPSGDASNDPFSAEDWTQIQLRHAQQHPSFVTWAEPERRRVRQPLEAFARERLRYVGWVSQGGVAHALVQVREETRGNTKFTPALGDTVYRVAVGSYLGQDWGLVSSVTPEHLRVREVVRNPEGVWSARHVVLPLEGLGP